MHFNLRSKAYRTQTDRQTKQTDRNNNIKTRKHMQTRQNRADRQR